MQQGRALLALVRWLQLYLLADPASVELNVAADLQGAVAGAFSKTQRAVEGMLACRLSCSSCS